jgi:hypothetical protein
MRYLLETQAVGNLGNVPVGLPEQNLGFLIMRLLIRRWWFAPYFP